ncbi:MAG: glycogen synthase [Anaerolineae bacterium]|nr:glycogen synthase [Anaerolineae bacterium]
MSKAPLKILFVAAEAVPFAKVGGLADVAGSLPRAIRGLGHDIRLIMPRYGTISSSNFDFKPVCDPFTVPVGPRREQVHLIGTMLPPDLPAYLVWNDLYFSSRDQVYGFEDDAQRFAVFNHAVLAALKQLNWKPDVIHVNDWHTGMIPTWLRMSRRFDEFYDNVATLFTVHSLAYQGITGRLILKFAQMEAVAHLEVEQPGIVNWLAQGIENADVVNTVSQSYAQEILQPDLSGNLAPLLQKRQDQLFGILNGLDYSRWDPSTDTSISSRFDSTSLNKRTVNKTALQQRALLPLRSNIPLIGMVTRLDHVKGMDLMEPVLDWLLKQDVQFVLLGTGQPEYHDMFKDMQSQYPDKMHAFLIFDETLARRIYAGADIFLMPSYIEPCGLGQMIAMHYGCIPVVRAVGGLIDTVHDEADAPGHGTGFKFGRYTPEACIGSLQQALAAYQDRNTWLPLQQRAMTADFSWTSSAQRYIELYRRAISLRGS